MWLIKTRKVWLSVGNDRQICNRIELLLILAHYLICVNNLCTSQYISVYLKFIDYI